MEMQMKIKINGFAYNLGHVNEFTARALEDDELLAYFAARGISRAEIERLLEAGLEVKEAFYNEAKPV